VRERTSVFLFFRDIKNNVGIVPLALVFRKAQLAALHMPDHFLVWNKFCDLLPAGSVLVASNAKGVTRVRVGEEFARAGIHTLRASSQGFLCQCATEAAIGSRPIR